jgi:hypothetical protein
MTNTVFSVWEKVERRDDDECWPWGGYTSSGYGRLDIGNVQGVYAHRAAFIADNPSCGLSIRCNDGRFVLHNCDNPLCCNPKHLRIGTHDDNMRDKSERGRCPDYRGTRSPRAKLTSDDVIDIRIMKAMGATKRSLALLYGVSTVTIKGCTLGRHYQDVR